MLACVVSRFQCLVPSCVWESEGGITAARVCVSSVGGISAARVSLCPRLRVRLSALRCVVFLLGFRSRGGVGLLTFSLVCFLTVSLLCYVSSVTIWFLHYVGFLTVPCGLVVGPLWAGLLLSPKI